MATPFPTGLQIQDHRQLDKTGEDPDVGEVCHQYLVDPTDLLALKQIGIPTMSRVRNGVAHYKAAVKSGEPRRILRAIIRVTAQGLDECISHRTVGWKGSKINFCAGRYPQPGERIFCLRRSD